MTGPAIARFKPIDGWNTFLARQRLEYYEPAAGGFIPWSGRTDVTCRLSLEPTGYTDEGWASTIEDCGPFDMVEASGDAGMYYYDIATSNLANGGLRDMVGDTIYLIVEGAVGYSGTYTLTVSVPLRVIEPRYAT